MSLAILTDRDMPRATGPAGQVRSRLKDPRVQWSLIQDAIRRLGDRDQIYRMIGEEYDRVPPDDPGLLQQDGLAWTANVNWGGMEEGIDEIVEAYNNFATKGETALRFTMKPSLRDGERKAAIIAHEDGIMLEEWEDYHEAWEEMLHYFTAYGMGFFYWPQPHGWEWATTHPSNFLYPQGLRKNPSQWPWIALKTKTAIIDLIDKLGDRQAAQEMGWNVGNIIRTIKSFAMHRGVAVPSGLYLEGENYARGIQDLDQQFLQQAQQEIDTYTCYVREWDGTVSERLICNLSNEPHFLYDVDSRHRRMPFCPFYISVGQGLLDRVRGYGEKMLPYYSMHNKALNHLVDTTWLASSLILQGNSGDDIEKLSQIVFGPFTLLENGVDVSQQAFSNPGQGLFQIMQYLDAQRSGRAPSAGAGPDMDRTEKTALEANLNFTAGKTLESFQKQRFRTYMNRFARLRWERTVDPDLSESDAGFEAAKEMLGRAKDRGVTKDDINAISRVQSAHVFGDGDPVQQQLILKTIEPFVLRSGSAQGIRQLSIDATKAATGDIDQTRSYIGNALVDDRDSTQRHQAQLENAAMESSDARIDVMGTEDDAIHTGAHLQFAEDKRRQFEEKLVGPEQTFQVISRVLAHLNGDRQRPGHLPRLAQNDLAVQSKVYDDMRRRAADLENLRRQLAQQLEARRAKEQEQRLKELRVPTPSPETVEKVETERAMREAQLKKVEAETQAIREKAAASVEAMRAKAAMQIEGERQKNALDRSSASANGSRQ